MTAAIAHPQLGALVASDTRVWYGGTRMDPLLVPVHRDLGGKLLRGRAFWLTATGDGAFIRYAERELARLHSTDPKVIGHLIGQLYARWQTAGADAPDAMFLIATPDGHAGAFDADGSRRYWNPSGVHFIYPPHVPEAEWRPRQAAFTREHMTSMSDVVRAVAREFAWAYYRGGAMSDELHIGTGSDTFIAGRAAELADASDTVLEAARSTAQPVPDRVFTDWHREVAEVRTA